MEMNMKFYKSISIFLAFVFFVLTNYTYASNNIHVQKDFSFDTTVAAAIHEIQTKTIFHNLVYQPMSDLSALRAVAHVVDLERFDRLGLKICSRINNCFVQFPPAGGKSIVRAKQKAERSSGYQCKRPYKDTFHCLKF